ncbi:MAG TPA: HDIG domain-containing protein [Tepidisphaeraceae bacterium]|jgi:putative nucleotidyltransferase with HDIG domain|nr:HDIG domain-containing protein [Tepidisphaeraceae bacterium]
MPSPDKSRSRRAEIRKNRPDSEWIDWQGMRRRGLPVSLCIAAGFFIVASLILMLRQNVVPYRPNQWLHHDIVSRVKFVYKDPDRLEEKRRETAARQPRVYSKNNKTEDVWLDVESRLLQLPDRVVAAPGELPPDLKGILDGGAATKLRDFATPAHHDDYVRRVTNYIDELKSYRMGASGREWPIIILDEDDRKVDIRIRGRNIKIASEGELDPSRTVTLGSPELRNLLSNAAQKQFSLALQPQIVNFTLASLQPNYKLDEAATAEAHTKAAAEVPDSEGEVTYGADEVLVFKSTTRPLDEAGWRLLRAEHQAYIDSLKNYKWKARLGVMGIVLAVTCVLCFYMGHYQPKVTTNHARAIAIAALLLSMLLLNQIAAIGTGPLYLFGTAPTLLVAMILAIGYDQRTAIGIGGLHGLLATIALDQGVAFFILIWVGVMTACFLLDDIRTRSKLVEVGGATALAMAAVTAATGLLAFDTWSYIEQNCLLAGASGLTAGFIVLGILPFVEKMFRITTSMTLLELADPSQPLLRRLAMEAPGTYNHSQQVGMISEAAAEAIGANALLCRVASYYHDVGKINKPEYFIENQAGRENRHINLTPNVSFLIITGHVKDGVELAKEYNLPASIFPFIQQHHGTTLVEYFYHQACNQQGQTDPGGPEIKDHQFRYDGPRPKTREVAIVMLADCVESASRTLADPTASRVESLVHDLAMKRLLDGQFDDCDLTMRQLEQIEHSMMKTILGIYHGRISYPPSSTPVQFEPKNPSGMRLA